jgi:hypothetical protein
MVLMIVIDTVPFTSSEGPLKLFNAFAKAVDSRPPGGHASYIYTGGSWTMSRGGGGLDKWTDERQPNAGRLQLTKWRSEVEKVVLACEFASVYYKRSLRISADEQRRRSMESSSDLVSYTAAQVRYQE